MSYYIVPGTVAISENSMSVKWDICPWAFMVEFYIYDNIDVTISLLPPRRSNDIVLTWNEEERKDDDNFSSLIEETHPLSF